MLLLGDSDHRLKNSIEVLSNQAYLMKEAGVKILCAELRNEDDSKSIIDRFNNIGNDYTVKDLVKETKYPECFIRMFKSVYSSGIKLSFIDKPIEPSDKWFLNDSSRTFKRSVYMGERVYDLIKTNPENKVVVFCGLEHLEDNQIPGVLTSKGVSFKKIALVPEGLDNTPLEDKLYPSSPSKAIKKCGKDNSIIYVDLKGSFGLDGFIYVPNSV